MPSRRTESTQRFLTYRHYLRSLAGLAGFASPTAERADVYPALARRVSVMPSCRQGQRCRVDEQGLKRSLTNAWGTELLLSLSGDYAVDDELLRITNNWAAVQLYYVFYHATQAYIVARGCERPDSHPKTQNIFMHTWVMRQMQCPPWTLGYGSAPRNVPSGHQLEPRITTVARPRTDRKSVV